MAMLAMGIIGCGSDSGGEEQGMDEAAQGAIETAAGSGETPKPVASPAQPNVALPSPSSVIGELTEAQLPSAQPMLCITLEEGSVSAIDGVACEHLPPGNEMCGDCEAVSFCNGCLLWLETTDDDTTLSARPGSSTCTIYAGSYEVLMGKTCSPPKSN